MQDSVLWTGRPVVIGGYRPAVHECEEADFFSRASNKRDPCVLSERQSRKVRERGMFVATICCCPFRGVGRVVKMICRKRPQVRGGIWRFYISFTVLVFDCFRAFGATRFCDCCLAIPGPSHPPPDSPQIDPACV